MAFAFEKLIVYQKSVDFADRITELTGQFQRGYYFLADQLNRAAVSIAANIAEGNGRFSAGIPGSRADGVFVSKGPDFGPRRTRSSRAPGSTVRPQRVAAMSATRG